MSLGKAIKLCRVQRGLSQTELAILAGMSTSYLSLLERDMRDPVLSTIGKIAKAVDVSIVIMLFMASSEDEMAGLDTELLEKLSHATLKTF